MKGTSKMKRLLSLILSLTIVVAMLPLCIVFADSTQTTVYFTISNQGILGTATDGSVMLGKEVVVADLDEDGSCTVDEALIAAHKIYNSEAGYYAPNGFVSKLWGTESTNNLFFVNNVGLTSGVSVDTVQNGDKLVASINADNVYYADWYTYFDADNKSVFAGEEFSLTLKGYYGMAYTDEDKVSIPLGNMIVKAGAVSYITDEEGKVTLSFDKPGLYYLLADGKVSDVVTDWSLSETRNYPGVYAKFDYSSFTYTIAYTEADYGDGPYPADEVKYIDIDTWSENQEGYNTLHNNMLLADCPVIATGCVVEVKEKPYIEIMHNIAHKFSQSGVADDGNMNWLLADMAVYNELYPESDYELSAADKQACIDKMIATAATSDSPSALAKTIIALRSLGYDAKNVITSDFQKLDIVTKLTDMVDSQVASVVNSYTVPYVIIALSQADNYATDMQIDYLVNAALASEASWTEWGSDGATPMFLALAPYYNTNENVKSVIDEKITEVLALQQNDGGVESSASTGLAIAGFSALGIDPIEITNNDASLIDGLMVNATDNLDGFMPSNNSFSTEQGFRGLLAWQRLKKSGKTMYDFSEYPLNQAQATWAQNCPVTFEVIPADAVVSIEGATAINKNSFDLAEGTYNYSVSKTGYVTKTGTLEITADDTAKHIEVSLQSMGGSGGAVSNNVSVTVKVMVHNESACNNSYTYKNNASAYTTFVSETVTLNKGQTVFDALDAALSKNNIEYVESSYGYISSIDGTAELDHGEKSGWMFMVNGNYVNTGCRDTLLSSNATVVWFFTDDYTKEKGAEGFSSGSGTISSGSSGGGSGGASVKKGEIVKEEEVKQETEKEIFNDVNENDWYYTAVKYAYDNKLMTGTGDGFEPDSNMTRAMLVTVLYRLAAPEENASTDTFDDVSADEWYYDSVNWAAKNSIVSGITDKSFAPNEDISREQTVTILYRYAKLNDLDTSFNTNMNAFDDAESVSEWATDAFMWAIDKGIITGVSDNELLPDGNATRAQIAAILMRFIENIVK